MDSTVAHRDGAGALHRRVLLRLMMPMLLLACSTGTEPRRASAVAIVAAPPSEARSGVTIGQATTVELRDSDGAPFAEAGVSIAASLQGGAATLGGVTSQVTDANGRAVFSSLVISGATGAYTLQFSSSGLTVASAPITVIAGPAATIVPGVTTLQGTVGTTIATLPSVVVKDASGNPVAGATVQFSASGGTLTGATAVTNASGVATLGGWVLPTTAGQLSLSVALANNTAVSAIVIQATATPDAPRTMTPSGGGQAALYGAALGTPLQVLVADRYGNPNPGVAITWASVSGAGVVTPIDVITDASGIARATYRLGIVPGANVVRASFASLGLSADFTETGAGISNQITVSMQHSCALDETGVAYCWGQNASGQVGDGTTTQRNTLTAVGGSLRFSRIGVHNGSSCGLTVSGRAYCWGSNGWAGLGDGTTTDRSVPTAVSFDGVFREVAPGGSMTCGIEAVSNAAYCWGSNVHGELGVGTAPESCTTSNNAGSFPCSTRPVAVAGWQTFASISAGNDHACALTAAGELYCWGESMYWGGASTPTSAPVPVPVAPGMSFSEVAAGGSYTCAIATQTSALYCWGMGAFGEVGTGSASVDEMAPVQVLSAAGHVDAGQMGTCAVLPDGHAQCWGFNQSGAVGDGTLVDRSAPTAATTALSFTSITASGDHSCARASTGQLLCWGNNSEGQAGVGGDPFVRVLVPTLVHP